MKLIENICYACPADEELHLDLYLPDSADFDLFVYFHGGGLESGHKADHAARALAPWLAERGVAVASCNYRMYPTAHYPDFLQDAASAIHFLAKQIGEYGSCGRIFVGGSSAGAYISMMLCFDGRWLAEGGDLPIPIAGYFHDAGQPTCHYNVLRERGIDRRRVIVDDSAPLYHICADANYPPMTFVVSDNDMKCRLEQTQLMMATLRHFKYDESTAVMHLMHGKHCEHSSAVDDRGDSVLGRMVLAFINGLN